MIPKIIHYCWFGNDPLPNAVRNNIDSWKRNCPDYQIREWNEHNFHVDNCDYCKEAYEERKWAFVSDYVRLKVLEQYGGIYMDTDVEVVKSFDDLLKYQAFMCFEEDNSVSVGTIGTEKGAKIIKNFLLAYQGRHFRKEDGSLDVTTNLQIITRVLLNEYGLILNGQRQILDSNILVLPMESFIAKDFLTGWIFLDKNTYAIHHYSASWYSEERKQYMQRHQYYSRIYIKKIEKFIGKIASAKVTYEFYGSWGVIKKMVKDLIRYNEN